jgi:hypothetical protein
MTRLRVRGRYNGLAAEMRFMTTTTQASDPRSNQRRDQWLGWVGSLLADVAAWAEAQGWSVHRDNKVLHEEALGTYQAPMLRVRTPSGELYVEPIALHVLGAEGRVDIQAWPSLNRVKLVRNGEEWRVVTDSGVPLRQPWDRQTFVQLAQDLTAAP